MTTLQKSCARIQRLWRSVRCDGLRRGMAESRWAAIPAPPGNLIFDARQRYLTDEGPSLEQRVDLTVGEYRGADGEAFVFPAVRETHTVLAANPQHSYNAPDGEKALLQLAQRVLLTGFGVKEGGEAGEEKEAEGGSPALSEQRVVSVQTIGGTGAVATGFDFLKRFGPQNVPVFVPCVTWDNHFKILSHLGYEDVRTYTYTTEAGTSVDVDAICSALENAPEGCIFLFHMCAHNPTGLDPSHDEWIRIVEIMKRRHIFPFLDNAYQGFATGDVDADAFLARYLDREARMEFMVACSFAKNFGVYGERVGVLHIVCADQTEPATVNAVRGHVKMLCRSNYSNPPRYGARVIAHILGNPDLRNSWKEDLRSVAGRVATMRRTLLEKLKAGGAKGDWEHVVQETGMFCMTGLSLAQIERLRTEHQVYLIDNSRMNIAGLTDANIDQVANGLVEVSNWSPENSNGAA